MSYSGSIAYFSGSYNGTAFKVDPNLLDIELEELSFGNNSFETNLLFPTCPSAKPSHAPSVIPSVNPTALSTCPIEELLKSLNSLFLVQ